MGSSPIISSRVAASDRASEPAGDAHLLPGGAVGSTEASGSNSVVESQPSKLLVAGPIPVSRSTFDVEGQSFGN